MSDINPSAYFLPYQIEWLKDQSRYKIMEKSRRIGMTYVQSYEDVRDAATGEGMDVWFSSADDSAAREYIRYCEQWTKLLQIGAESLGEVVIDSEKDIKVYVIEFANGRRINALSSNPKAFRSKGGKLVLDEFAFHESPDAMWKAARPIVTWGYPVRILSTYNGKSGRYYRMVEQAKLGKGDFKLHTCNIEQAVGDGLADKIMGRLLTALERKQWILAEKSAVGDEEAWQQEYMCNPADEATAWLTWDLIHAAQSPEAGKPEQYQNGLCYVGVDIGLRRDLFVIWVLERVGDVLITREVIKLKKSTFAQQDAELRRVMKTYRVAKACIDQTGLGEKSVEDAQAAYGKTRVHGVLMTNPAKQALANGIKGIFEDRKTRIPVDTDTADSLHSVRKLKTLTGLPKFDAERSEATGHADEFWALALAIEAGEGKPFNPTAKASGTTTYQNRRHFLGDNDNEDEF